MDLDGRRKELEVEVVEAEEDPLFSSRGEEAEARAGSSIEQTN